MTLRDFVIRERWICIVGRDGTGEEEIYQDRRLTRSRAVSAWKVPGGEVTTG
jgi:hypothetical protein